ncbi:MAG: rod shape-determining protein MreD [Burkholderiaceae bacterium]|jgi:rod shape-determining protein MreD
MLKINNRIALGSTAPHAILRPVNPIFIAFSFGVALTLNLLPWGRMWVVPDFLALVLVFWNVKQPRKVGMGLAWLFGMLMDVHAGSMLGEHALAYTLLAYFAIALHRRVPWFSAWGQAAHVLPLFVGAQLVMFIIRLLSGGMAPPWWLYLQGLATAVLWPLVSWLLLAPQHRAHNRDDTRPL